MSIVALKKDWKSICAIKCPDPPAELPRELSISSIVAKKKISDIVGLPQFSAVPAPRNLHDENEWGRFLNFLCKNEMVAVINFEQYRFYILPPVKASTPSSTSVAVVAYQIDNTCRPRDCESGSHLAEECGGPDTFSARGPTNGADVCSSQLQFPPGGDRAYCFTAETCGRFQSHVKQDRVPEKNFIRADPSYLKTLGQVHSGWIFGGIAELVDNSNDAKATKMDIFIDMIKMKNTGKDVPMLSVIDDGQGMNHDEVVKMVCFGHKRPDKDDKDHIGRFGVGFKTGAMRLGRDVLVLTQTATSRSIAFLSQSLNEGKDNIEIPIVSYCRQGQRMEIDTNAQSEMLAKYNLKAIKDFSPFNKYLIGEKAAMFCGGTGTQIFIWNLDEWGSEYCLEWHVGLKGGSSFHQGDIFIRSKRSRSRLGQTNRKVKSRPLANFLSKTSIETGDILGRSVELILGFSQLEWDQASCGIFLYWHGRLIEVRI